LRTAVWYSNYGLPDVSYNLPYVARSPVLYKKIKYDKIEDVYDEIYRIVDESDNKGYPIAESLFYQLPFFCDPKKIISDWCWDMITDYFTVKKYNVPLANCLHEVDPFVVDCFSVIENEIKNIAEHEKKKDGN